MTTNDNCMSLKDLPTASVSLARQPLSSINGVTFAHRTVKGEFFGQHDHGAGNPLKIGRIGRNSWMVLEIRWWHYPNQVST
jgi:hypothetical protein